MLVAIVLIIFSVLLVVVIENRLISQRQDQIEAATRNIQYFLETHDSGNVIEELNVVSQLQEDSLHIVLFRDNQLIYSDQSKFPFLQSYFTQNTFFTPLLNENKSISVIQTPKETGVNTIFVGTTVMIEDETYHIIVYEVLEQIAITTSSTTQLVVISSIIAIVLTTLFALFLTTRITAPLRKMREMAIDISKGEFRQHIPFDSHDEIGALASSFNQMGDKLERVVQELKREKEQLSNILKNLSDGVITFQENQKVLVSNPLANQFIKQWNKSLGEKSKTQIPVKLKEVVYRVLTSQKQELIEVSTGSMEYIVLVTPVKSPILQGAIAVIRDVSEERKLEKLRKDFIANISHELRTPISMVQGYSEAIVDDIASSELEKVEIAKVIYEESERMGRLVSDLLDLAKMEAGKIPLEVVEVELKPYFERILKKFVVYAREKKISLSLDLMDEFSRFRFDPDRIEQVITNLVDNSLRHSPNGGKIELSVRILDGYLQVLVSDNGSGIAQEDVPFIFERFYKADKARTRGKSGTGLGLAIAKNIVQNHQGTIDVTSKMNVGTTFTILLPRN
jgi:two-component system sensor histidine kinase ResE